MPDFGIYTALAGVDNWSEKRRLKSQELQLVSLQNQLLEKRMADQQAAAQATQEYMNTIGQLRVLDPDSEKIKSMNKTLIEPIREGIAKAGGDLKKYMLSGGALELQKYKQVLLSSPEVKRGLMNAFNHNKAIADEDAGLTWRKTGWKTPEGDIQGDYRNNYQDFISGKTDVLNYRGGYERPDLTGMREYFSKVYGKDPYKTEPVNPQTHFDFAYAEAKKKGMRNEDAVEFATGATEEYVQMVKQGGTPIYFGQKQKPYHPYSAAWASGQNAYLSARANVDQWDAILNPDYDGWTVTTTPYKINEVDKNGNIVGKKTANGQVANMIPVPLGKKTITYEEKLYDNKGKQQIKEITKEIDDAIEPIIKIGDGLYVQTTADRLQGKPPVPFESKSFNKLLMALPNTPDGLRIAAAYRKVLTEKGLLNPDGTVNFDLNNQQGYTEEQEADIKINMESNPDYTREEIIELLGY